MNILLASTDLLAGSQLEGAARAAGAELITAAPAKTAAAAEEHAPRLIAIDLASPLGDLKALVDSLRAAAPTALLLAFGPHVHEAKLQAATDAGCDHVMSRGQFHKQAKQIVANLIASE